MWRVLRSWNTEQARALIIVKVGKSGSWVEALSNMLCVIGEPAVGDSVEWAITLATNLD